MRRTARGQRGDTCAVAMLLLLLLQVLPEKFGMIVVLDSLARQRHNKVTYQ